MESILNSVKMMIPISIDEHCFDSIIIFHINSIMSTLCQIGYGPVGFKVEDEIATWEQYLGDEAKYAFVKEYIQLSVKMLFDPPTSSTVAKSYEEKIKELEFRIYSDSNF